MSHRMLVFVAGPYAADSREEIERNVKRATLVGQYAAAQGFAPIVPHLHGWAGLFGTADDDGTDSADRDAAIASSCAQAFAVGYSGGLFYAIARDDGGLTAGCSREYDAFCEGIDAAQENDSLPDRCEVVHGGNFEPGYCAISRWRYWVGIMGALVSIPEGL